MMAARAEETTKQIAALEVFINDGRSDTTRHSFIQPSSTFGTSDQDHSAVMLRDCQESQQRTGLKHEQSLVDVHAVSSPPSSRYPGRNPQ